MNRPTHRDFKANQVLLTDEGVVILDLDEAAWADPVADLGQFIARLERDALHGDLAPDRVALLAAALVEGYRAGTGRPVPPRLALHTAVGLFRHAPRAIRNRGSDWLERVEATLARVEEILAASPPAPTSSPPGRATRERRAGGPQAGEGLLGEQSLDALRRRGYSPGEGSFPTGRPDRATLALVTRAGAPAVGKLYPCGGGETAYANMQALWRSSFGAGRRPPGLPRPLAYLPEAGMLVMERLEGRPLAEGGPDDENPLKEVVWLLASLHECGARPPKRRDWRGLVRSIGRKAEEAAEHAPQLADAFREVAEAFGAGRVEEAELVPCHGDFTPRNILVGPGRVALIDWDRFQLADPARDLSYFGCWYWVRALRQGKPAGWDVLHRAAALYGSARPRTRVEPRLDRHVAAGLVRMAHSLVTLWADDAEIVSRLLAEALRRLR